MHATYVCSERGFMSVSLPNCYPIYSCCKLILKLETVTQRSNVCLHMDDIGEIISPKLTVT